MSVRKEGLALPFRSDPGMGRGPPPDLGRNGSPGPFSCFYFFSSFSFSVFLISFLDFAFVTQMTSNQFVKFSKNQRNKLGQ
jgi:hypothetical protein